MKATFAAGCFWGVEELFRNTKGVTSTVVGYTGGHLENPTYKNVCSGRTGHAESVQIEFDPKIISYEKLLEIFWDNHDPTTQDRQGPDVGSQYRSVVFYHDDEQKNTAINLKKKLDNSGRFSRPIVTEITKASTFYNAEDYHQQYLAKGGTHACSFNDRIRN
jgi:peptide-methionine (S)-S-oxide reductase